MRTTLIVGVWKGSQIVGMKYLEREREETYMYNPKKQKKINSAENELII
jgi:hypothetical protein